MTSENCNITENLDRFPGYFAGISDIRENFACLLHVRQENPNYPVPTPLSPSKLNYASNKLSPFGPITLPPAFSVAAKFSLQYRANICSIFR